MDKKRLRISLKVLEAVKERFPDTKNFIDDMIDENVKRKRYPWKRYFFYKFRSKKLAQKNIFCLVVSM